MSDTKDLDDEAIEMRANRHRYHKSRGKKLMAKAEKTLTAKVVMNGFLVKFETAAFQYYQAALSFRACSVWRDAGYCLVRCASLHQYRLRLMFEAAMLYSEAADVYSKIDKGEAMKNYKHAISLYCDLGRFDVAGRIQKMIAMSHFRLKHYEEAGEGFRKAADFLSGIPEQSDYCLERAAECLIELNELESASELYAIVAESYAQSNLRYFNCRDKLFRSIMCLMGTPLVPEVSNEEGKEGTIIDDGSAQKYANIRSVVADYERIDVLWRCSKEVKFINNIIDCREDYDLNEFADHVYYFHTARSMQKYDLKLLNVVCDEIQAELERREEQIRRDRLEATKFERRKARLAKKRKALADRGLDPESIQLSDINVDEDSDEENNASVSVEKASDSSGSDDDDSDSSSSESDDSIDLPDELKEKPKTPPKPRRRREKNKKKEVDDTPAYLKGI